MTAASLAILLPIGMQTAPKVAEGKTILAGQRSLDPQSLLGSEPPDPNGIMVGEEGTPILLRPPYSRCWLLQQLVLPWGGDASLPPHLSPRSLLFPLTHPTPSSDTLPRLASVQLPSGPGSLSPVTFPGLGQSSS